MGPEFDRNLEGSGNESFETVRVHDTIVMNTGIGLQSSPGLVVILVSYCPAEPHRFVGETARIIVGDSTSELWTIRAVRDHGSTISFFFEGLNKADVPIGSWVEFQSIAQLDPFESETIN